MDTGRGYTRGFVPAGVRGYGYGSRFQTRAQSAYPTVYPRVFGHSLFGCCSNGFGDPRVTRTGFRPDPHTSTVFAGPGTASNWTGFAARHDRKLNHFPSVISSELRIRPFLWAFSRVEHSFPSISTLNRNSLAVLFDLPQQLFQHLLESLSQIEGLFHQTNDRHVRESAVLCPNHKYTACLRKLMEIVGNSFSLTDLMQNRQSWLRRHPVRSGLRYEEVLGILCRGWAEHRSAYRPILPIFTSGRITFFTLISVKKTFDGLNHGLTPTRMGRLLRISPSSDKRQVWAGKKHVWREIKVYKLEHTNLRGKKKKLEILTAQNCASSRAVQSAQEENEDTRGMQVQRSSCEQTEHAKARRELR
ncbi:hypothetical protein DFH08DRAFT_824925 [Mycena albidolilacea]|uniref:Uncharacterized protein n=1 Tax=Mycena albidolilacea TaxID=1033008 RepID=A0AAD6Z3J4_9AGAR|nr:hypothetical protein DFH08DRAFT_824925 [Mycena albidolilacea]